MVQRWCSSQGTVVPICASLTEGLGTCVRWSLLPILAWVSEKEWWQNTVSCRPRSLCVLSKPPPPNITQFLDFLGLFCLSSKAVLANCCLGTSQVMQTFISVPSLSHTLTTPNFLQSLASVSLPVSSQFANILKNMRYSIFSEAYCIPSCIFHLLKHLEGLFLRPHNQGATDRSFCSQGAECVLQGVSDCPLQLFL